MNKKDTSRSAQQVLLDIYRQMPVTVKVARIFDAYQTGKMLKIAGLRQLYPDASDKQLWYLWAKQHLGEKLFNEAYGDVADNIANIQKNKKNSPRER